MNKILSLKNVNELAIQLHQQHKRIVLAGGCFDLLHIGHIVFLESAKKYGDMLILLVESDETITKSKGPKRPINTQHDRAKILSAIEVVDYVILLDPQMSNNAYDDLVFSLKPVIIATTEGDMNRKHKERQAQKVQAKVVDVTMPITDKSTTKLIDLLNEL